MNAIAFPFSFQNSFLLSFISYSSSVLSLNCFILVLAIAIWIAFGTFHQHHRNGEAVILILPRKSCPPIVKQICDQFTVRGDLPDTRTSSSRYTVKLPRDNNIFPRLDVLINPCTIMIDVLPHILFLLFNHYDANLVAIFQVIKLINTKQRNCS